AGDADCYAPAFLAEPDFKLERAADSVRRDSLLRLLIVSGSPSQVEGTKGLLSYPSYLANALRRRLPGVDVEVEVRAQPRRNTAEAVEAIPRTLYEARPALVVWQVGTVDMLQKVPPKRF